MDDYADLLTSIDVANLLNLSTERVRQLSRAGALNPRRTPHGTRIFSRAEVLKLKVKREGQRKA